VYSILTLNDIQTDGNRQQREIHDKLKINMDEGVGSIS